MQAHLKQGVTTLCTCLDILRNDGKSYRFTDHDEPVTVAGALYTPVASFARNSVSTTLDLSVDSTEIHGILNDNYISRAAVVGGLFDNAAVQLFVVNYEAPDSGKVIMRSGHLGEVTTSEDGTFSAELRGLTQALTFRIGESYSPECRAQLGDSRCKIALQPNRWTEKTTYKTGDVVQGLINPATAYVNLELQNGGFDDDGEVDLTRDVTGWTSYGDSRGRWTIRSEDWGDVTGHDGFSAYGTDDGSIVFDDHGNPQYTVASIGMYQDIDLEAQGMTSYSLDTGLCRVYATVWTICINAKHGSTRFRIVPLDGGHNQIGATPIYDTGTVNSNPLNWVQYTANNVLVPAGTRFLRIMLDANKNATDGGGGGFDTVMVAINDPDGTFGGNDQFDGVAFMALNSGTSGATEPAWPSLIGSTQADGNITWKCIRAYNKTCTVASADGVVVVPQTLTDETGYYDGGLLKWETGLNTGRTMEIKSWAGNSLSLFERPFYPPAIGDRFVVYPGCDLLRSTCISKFANLLNFRGEPDVPGQDKYYSTPNAATN